ncbi:MAG: guanylate kinase [Gammaproteobacteria bacterium]|nr:guanylate kinase [Gammaproteobacteria bacterium]
MSASATVPGHLWIVSAPSGAGKTSLSHGLVRRLIELGVPAAFSVSYTTRAPRPGERDGGHYHFLDAERFAAMADAGEFLEHATVFGQRYGTGSAATERRLAEGCELLLDIDWQGARQIRARRPDARSVFILPPSPAELERRLRARGQDSEQVIAERLRAAREEMKHCREYDALVVNDDFPRALTELTALVLAQRLRRDEQLARHAALLHELLGG